ncbi:glutamyl-tRNA reductase [Enemella evansiae]|uniref:Glutamyl-tRNA reductase n=1 Tax=Enemella evansiae TaxID=2016499 RepID=A0A255GFS7_9ACTN|nr:glutamyl-tRNA reductase [Enemella evansiae]PFG65953.1 glutamyl-tRNA reductase [Propionibacteriaceae bacterium ES.041]OYN99785.1 glutamyl-tRNA reductase [Enemella evansiae]OYO00116.1 glutamyl-tRNA reductase [Enemella evansiae]OYO04591.1 glutamyl-tRNA reductase [Enemella evansiae]OYO09171.1 glutamyl-tRNA reductase [Enemella evansiae]
MSILVVSLSHRTAPMDLLGRLSLDADASGKLTQALVGGEHVDEAVVLSTCNRLEVYAAVTRFHGGLGAATAELAGITGVSVDEIQDNCAVFYDEAAVSHCFAVASGLDSMVAGEHQILGQVRGAYSTAQQSGTVGTSLNSLFQQGLRVAKRVQSETRAGTAGRSVVTAGLAALTDRGVELAGRRVLVVGAGSMASLAAHTVADQGAHLTCVNRTLDKAERLAAVLGGTARPLAELDQAMAEADVLISCTGARGLRITADQVAATQITGVLDLALPADVDEAVGALPGVQLVSLANLAEAAEQTDLDDAEELVLGEVRDFLGLRRAAAVAPTVVALRTMATEVMTAELGRLDARLPELGERERREIEQTVRRVVEKLLHQPTVRVKELAAQPDSPDYAAALRELFALEAATIDAVSQPR